MIVALHIRTGTKCFILILPQLIKARVSRFSEKKIEPNLLKSLSRLNYWVVRSFWPNQGPKKDAPVGSLLPTFADATGAFFGGEAQTGANDARGGVQRACHPRLGTF